MMTKTRRGFTLIEVLIALTLLSMMVVLLFASLKIGANSWHKGETKIAAVNEVAVVYHFFQNHLAAAKPLADVLSKNELPPLAFQGKEHSVQFVSGFPASVGRSGLQLFTVALAKEADEQVIKVTMMPFFPMQNTRDTSTKEEVVLLRGVSDFSLSYYGSDDGIESSLNNNSWRNEWLDKPTQPRLIKIHIQRAKQDFWPDIVIALKNTAQQMIQETIISDPERLQ